MPNNRKKKTNQNKAMADARLRKREEEAKLRKKKQRKNLIIGICISAALVAAVIVTVVLILANAVYYSKHLESWNVEGHDIAIVSMEIEDYGEVTLLLDGTNAPITTENFVKLVNDGFYNGKTFHRIVKGFMIQGGDPDATGGGGLDEKIKGEFTNNGVYNTMSHLRGTISMARSNDKNSASCQFFICNTDYTNLDGNYAAFGYVIEGLEVIDKVTDTKYKLTDRSEDKPDYKLYGGTIRNKIDQPVIKSCKVLPSYYSKVTGKTYVTKTDYLTLKTSATAKDTDKCEYYYTRNVTDHELVKAVVSIKDYGNVTLLLDATTAPRTVANFVDLVNQGFYNGKTFHRIVEGFVIQGGDPEGNGTGGTLPITGEFPNNGYENDILHKRGVISMARSSDMNSASCQFFICQKDATNLDGDYAAFGYVIEGMQVIDRVISIYKAYATGSKGVITNKENQPVISSITIVN